MEHTKFTPGAFRAARRFLVEVHFDGKSGDDCTGANHPENAKFLDRRAAELAHIVDEETAAPDLWDCSNKLACEKEKVSYLLAACKKAELLISADIIRDDSGCLKTIRSAIAAAEGRSK